MPATMTKTMTVDELKQLVSTAENRDIFTVDPRTGDSRFVLDEGQDGGAKIRFAYKDRKYSLRSDAFVNLGKLLGIPGNYVQKMTSRPNGQELMIQNMNYWLPESGFSALSFGTTQLGNAPGTNGMIEVFSKGEAQPMSNFAILDAVNEIVGNDLDIYHVSHDFWNTSFSLVAGDADAIAVGDTVRTGVTIENSYAMQNPLTVSAYVHRLVCTNGMISTQNVHAESKNRDVG